MRPVRRGSSPRSQDFQNYQDAKPFLTDRLGTYCSYCERRFPAMLHVDHIHPKSVPQYRHLVGRWDNFLLACGTCNPSKGTQAVELDEIYLPDRDNTAVVFTYRPDGTIEPSDAAGVSAEVAQWSLTLAGLARTHPMPRTSADLLKQRLEAWLLARDAQADLGTCPESAAIRRRIVGQAVGCGFFSIWLTVFAEDANMRHRLIKAFPGTRDSGCFDPITAAPVSPAPNHDALPHGGKI